MLNMSQKKLRGTAQPIYPWINLRKLATSSNVIFVLY